MANALYAKGKEKILTAQINMSTADIQAVLLKSAYTPNLSTHEYLADIAANVVDTAVSLTTKTITAGVFDADDTIFTTVAAGDTVGYVALFKNTGVSATSPLIALIDSASAGLPATTNGDDIKAQWDNGAYKIFSL